MNEALWKNQERLRIALIIFGVTLLSLGLQGCQQQQLPDGNNGPITAGSGISTSTPSPNTVNMPSAFADETTGNAPQDSYQPVWESWPPPSIDPATPIPPPLKGLLLSDEVLIWVLLGSDTEPPFLGRTPAIHLLFIHPRFSRASLVSIPGDLYVYIPGFTMQRLNTAYSLGGMETLRKTLAYNFGVNPSRFVLAHPGDFQWLVDDVGTIDVTVFYPIPHACGGIRAGLINMDGALALCYASFREGMDEIDRMHRQQQLLRIVFRKLTRDGNLIQLPVLFTSYEGWVITDFSLLELMGNIPLALRLADPDRIGYYMIGWDEISLWDVPDHSQAQVFLPDRDGVKQVLQNAIDAIMTPKPFTNLVQTLEAQLTAAYHNTASAIPTPTPTPSPPTAETPPGDTPTPPFTETPTGEPPSPPTPTLPGYP